MREPQQLESCVASPPAPAAPSASLASPLTSFRYIVISLIMAFLLMSLSLHLPIDALLPGSAESFLFPSFMFFMPLTRAWLWILPPDWLPDTLGGSLAMCAFDILLAAVFCLPFLFPNDRRQATFAGFSLIALTGYVLLAAFRYLRMPGI